MNTLLFVVDSLGSVGGAFGAYLGRRAVNRRLGRRSPWHRRIVSLAARGSAAGGQQDSKPSTLRATVTPSSAVVLCASIALVRPWGPLAPDMGLSLGLLGAAVASLGAGAIDAWWNRTRRRELFPDWLSFLAAAMELGMPFGQALGVAAAAVDAPLRQPAEQLALDVGNGEETGACLERFAVAIDTQDARFVIGILARHERLGAPVTAALVQEEGLLSRMKTQEHQAHQGLIPYAFTASAGVLLVNAVLLFVVPRAAALLATFRLPQG